MRPGSSFISFSRRSKRVRQWRRSASRSRRSASAMPGKSSWSESRSADALAMRLRCCSSSSVSERASVSPRLASWTFTSEALVDEAFECRQQVGDIALDQRLHARRCHLRRRAGIAERFFELVKGALLTAFAERPQRLAVALGLSPDRRNRDDLFVQPSGASAVNGKPSHEHHTRLRAGAFDYGNARQPGLETLGNESRQKAANQPVLEMDLHHSRRVATIG